MEDSKHTIEKKTSNWQNINPLAVVVIVAIVVTGGQIFLFNQWFGNISSYPVEERQLVFHVISSPIRIDSLSLAQSESVIIDNRNQIDSLQSLLLEIKVANEKISQKIINREYLNVSNLSAFYASLFTAITVIVAIAGLIGWRSVSGYTKDLDERISKVKEIKDDIDKQTEETEKIFEREQNKSELVNWTEEQFQLLELKNLTSLPQTKEIKKHLEKIENYVISEFTIDSKLETFYAYHLAFTNKKRPEYFIKAQKILKSILERDLLDDIRLKGQIFHILGQINFELYLLKSEKCNLFKSSDLRLTVPLNTKEAIELLKFSASYYKKSFETKEKSEPIGIDETRGNLAMVLIELHKFTVAYRDEKELIDILDTVKIELFEDVDIEHVSEQDFLKHANQYQKKIEDKSFNQLWDDVRRIYYENKFEERIETGKWTDEDVNIWGGNIHDALVHCIERKIRWSDADRKWKMGDREFFLNQLKKEILEFNEIGKKGFPGKMELITEIEAILTKK